MHSSLASLSPELQTLDSIIERPLATLDGTHLPTEILLHIRSYILPTVTNHLMQRSAAALARYESSIRDLLCSDCIAYNQFVYGPDIWQWEHFTGSCECIEMMRITTRPEVFAPEYSHPNSDLQAFATPMDWLEFYLSAESSRLKWKSAYENKPFAIWDVVDEVLRGRGCYIIRDVDAACSGGANSVMVAALPSLSGTRNPEEEVIGIPDEDSRVHGVLYQAKRDLGLSIEYKGNLQLQISKEVPLSRLQISSRPWPRSVASAKSPSRMSLIPTRCLDILKAIATLNLALLSLPLTFATVALTILCFYSKPRSLRIM